MLLYYPPKTWLVIHPKRGWLGTSPDGHVVNKLSNEPEGILEIKCAFSKQDILLLEACQGINFYCEANNSVNVVHTLILTSAVQVAILLQFHQPIVAGSPLSFDGQVVW